MDVQVVPPFVLRNIESMNPLTATSVWASTIANPLRGPVSVTFKVCHVFPPSRLCHTQLEVVKSPLMTAQPSLLLRKAISAVFEHVSQPSETWMIERSHFFPPLMV
jgi:hypothetical protein